MEEIEIDLVITNPWNGWGKDDERQRNEFLARFPHSVPVATSYLEMDYAEAWLVKAIGPRGKNWEFMFYYKQDYNFGYAEYFFQEEGVSSTFKNEIPHFYGVGADGKRYTTNGQGYCSVQKNEMPML